MSQMPRSSAPPPRQIRADRREIHRDGETISYSVRGSGPPLLLGHSLLLNGAMWEFVEEPLAQHYRVINIDARGHRHSTARRPFTLEALADDWWAVANAEGLSEVGLVGLSMGGMTAMRAALLQPERVRCMVLMDTSAAPQPTLDAWQFRVMAELTRRFGYLSLLIPRVTRLFLSPKSMARDATIAAWLEAHIRGNDPQQVYHAIRAVIDRSNVAERLAELELPALVLVGSDDVTTPPRDAQAIVSKLPQCEFMQIQHVGHLPPVEAPADTLNALLAFLQRHDP